MPDIKPSVVVTSSTVEKMSRHDMLEWVNSTVHGQYKKIEELCSGVAYCQLMELLFPNCIGLKRVKISAKLEHEYLHNLKLFQAALTRLNFDKSVPIERLLKGRFQDNFEFLQWFKKFFDVHAGGKENLKVPAALAAAAANAPKPIRKPVTTPAAISSGGATKTKTTPNSTAAMAFEQTPKSSHSVESLNECRMSPDSLSVLQETHAELSEQMISVEDERNYFYKKLMQIEALLNESLKKNEHVEWSKRALETLYNNGDDAEEPKANVPTADL